MSISLEELRNEWSEHGRRVEDLLKLSAAHVNDDWIEQQRKSVLKLGQFAVFNIALWVAAIALLGMFLGKHWVQPDLFATALLLDVWVITPGVVHLRQQRALWNLDFGLPLLELQTRLAALRIARIRSFNVALLTGQIVWWIPFVVVVFSAVFDVNLYQSATFRAFAAWNVGLGIAFIPLAIGLSRRFGERLSGSSALRHLADSIAGRDMAAAHAYLGKLRRFGVNVE